MNYKNNIVMEKENSEEKETKQVLKELNNELIEKIIATTSQRARDNIEGFVPIYIGAIAMAVLFYGMSDKTLFSLVLCVFLISVSSIMAWIWIKHLENTQKQEQDIEKNWQTKLIDVYGKLLENQIRIENKLTDLRIKEIEHQNESPENIKKKEEEKKKKEKEGKEAEMNKKKHDLEMAKLEYEIQKKVYEKNMFKIND